MNDLADREGITTIVHNFYELAMEDEFIGYIFTDVAKLDLETHLPRIADFWDSVLFGTGKYQGNPVLKHVELNRRTALNKTHFEKWLALWEKVIYAHVSGPKSQEMVSKARMMAELMQYKIDESNSKGFVQ